MAQEIYGAKDPYPQYRYIDFIDQVKDLELFFNLDKNAIVQNGNLLRLYDKNLFLQKTGMQTGLVSCRLHCLENKSCLFSHFDYNAMACALFGAHDNTIFNQGMRYKFQYVSKKNTAVFNYDILFKKDIPYYDVPGENYDDLDTCIIRCYELAKSDRCNAVLINNSNLTCNLKNVAKGSLPNDSATWTILVMPKKF